MNKVVVTGATNASKFMSVSGWKPQRGLEDIIQHARAWYNNK
jgi:nucleoside-diphosphate-sugar epimerase